MEDIDVAKELEARNKEIFLNKLNIDLDKIEELIILSSKNQFNKLTDEVLNAIITFTSNSVSHEAVKHIVNTFFKSLSEKLNNHAKKRTSSLKEKLDEINKDDYLIKLEESSQLVINSIIKNYEKNVNSLIEELNSNNNDFEKQRLSNYLNDNVLKKIINNLNGMFQYSNMIIYNDYLENYERMENINNKTIK